MSNAAKGRKGYLLSAIRKYGVRAFTVRVLGTAKTRAELNRKEARYIQKFKSFDRRYGYNLTLGGDGVVMNEATRRKVSRKMRAAWKRPETRRKQERLRSRKQFKRTYSEHSRRNWARPEYRKVLSTKAKKRWASKSFRRRAVKAMRTAYKNPEVRRKLSLAMTKSHARRRAAR